MIPRLPKGFTHPMHVGGGAFATVYRARQSSLDRWVALKVVEQPQREARRRLLREATVQAGLRLSCIPQVYDAFEWGRRICIVMQWIYGVNLTTLLEHSLTTEERIALASGFLGALAELHGQGYAHRDIKPANVLISPHDGVFLIDFGFTKNVADGSKSIAGSIKGTPAYMAPELWEGSGAVDYMRADVYSAGKVLRQIVGGRAPFADFAEEMLREDPSHRPSSGVEVLDRWRALVANRPPVPWDRLAAALSADTLAPKLYTAAKQLLHAGKEDEAYWLLVECLELNPDVPEAVELMSAFPEYARRQAGKRRTYAVAGAIGAAMLVVFAFLAGRRAPATKSMGRSPTGEVALNQVRLHAPPSPASPRQRNLALRADTLKTEHLVGRLMVLSPARSGVLLVDNKPVASEGARWNSIVMPYGTYALSWRESDGSSVWRERVRLLPFQTKVIVIRRR